MSHNVLISWSKDRSHAVALKLHEWLPKALPGAKPWISTKDIDKGKEWFRELQSFLSGVRLCIICMTKENIRSPWLYYEVGAIAAKIQEDVSICPFLIDVEPNELSGTPLQQFQCTVASKDDILRLLFSLNKAIASNHAEPLLGGNFDSQWPSLQRVIKQVVDATSVDNNAASQAIRTNAEELAGQSLDDFERRLLLTASFDSRTLVSYFEATGGYTIHVGTKQIFGGAEFRELESWMSAIKNLTRSQCLRQTSTTDWNLTPKGYKVADEIRFANFDDAPALSKLSADARKFLGYAAEGEVVVMETLDQDSVTLNGRQLLSANCTIGDAKDALGELEALRLVRQDTQGFYTITKKGSKVAEAIKLGE